MKIPFLKRDFAIPASWTLGTRHRSRVQQGGFARGGRTYRQMDGRRQLRFVGRAPLERRASTPAGRPSGHTTPANHYERDRHAGHDHGGRRQRADQQTDHSTSATAAATAAAAAATAVDVAAVFPVLGVLR